MGTLLSWLQALGLERYAGVFAEQEVDLDALRLLSEADLERLGLPLGPRRKLLKALAEPDESLRSACPGLQLVHRRVRLEGLERGQGVARRTP